MRSITSFAQRQTSLATPTSFARLRKHHKKTAPLRSCFLFDHIHQISQCGFKFHAVPMIGIILGVFDAF